MSRGYVDRDRLQAILEFWHRVEFFIPFDVSARAEPQEGRASFWLHAESLDDDAASASRPIIPEGKEIAGFKVFFGVFDKSEMAETVRRFCRADDEMAAYEDMERADLEGDTCFASLDLDAQGCPLFTSFSVSTLPWALGRVKAGGLSALSSGAFQAGRQRLTELLANFAAQRHMRQPADDDTGLPLSAAEIGELHAMLQDWAGFHPTSGRPLAMVEVRFRDRPKTSRKKQIEAQQSANVPSLDEEAEPEEPDDEQETPEYEIGILNSFYLDDIERAIASVRDGVVPETLRRYLTPGTADARVDLYSGAGRSAILNALHPHHLNRGRWPGAPHHAMSLMQQFAINMARKLDTDSDLFSVNGPPGTGKTTLLRDIIADNIVRRATVLAALPSARAAFDRGVRTITFADGKSIAVSVLKPELTGFEMVVASSNNAAVENISRDLPKRASLWENAAASYLQPVAHNVAALQDSGSFKTLKTEDQPWGLISCALGNSKNRWAFVKRFSKPIKDRDHSVKTNGLLAQNIWGWLETYHGPSFAAAGEAFLAAQAEVDARLSHIARYADLFAEVRLSSCEDYCRAVVEEQRQAADMLQSARHLHEDGLSQVATLEERLSRLQEDARLIEKSAPAWWSLLLPTATGRHYRASRSANAQAQMSINDQLASARQSLLRLRDGMDAASVRLGQSEALLGERRNEWARKYDEFTRLGTSLGFTEAPRSLDDLETDAIQIAGLWHDDELARRRSELFSAALDLHAAWFADVGQKGGGFRSNIFAVIKLLSGHAPVDRKDILPLWQSFFMIVPVVSTTFASFARQFQGIGSEEIGWLFIDEAGQAVPQAAVGALTRARRAVVIGDPLQIEPVFTLPAAFIKALADLSAHTADGTYSPTRTSVQVLADAANRHGTSVQTEGDEALWIGSPLRVHRRCIDPMFTLANRIAYHGKMVFAAGQRAPSQDVAPFYGDSAWIDIRGPVSGKQTVAGQVGFVAAVLAASFRRDGVLPNLYVISPFKETRDALKREIGRAIWIGPDNRRVPRPKGLAGWLKNRVGTVHTFQGKEEDAVFMVLGTDATRRGAAKWASSKPNLLNVAATRARNRLFIVGDYDLWRGMPYFADAAGMLQPVQGDQFLTRI